MTALITCGHTRAGLAATRALGRAGIAVAVAAPVRPALAMWSRFATSTLLVPEAGGEARRFAEAVGDEAAGRHCDLVLAATDDALWALSRWRDLLPVAACRALPPHDAVTRVLDRTALYDRARGLGVATIDALRIDVPEAVEPALLRIDAERALPLLVRPLVPWVEREDGTRRVADSIPVETIAELRQLLYAREDLVAGGCLLEPRPPGRWISYGAVCDGGRVLGEVFQERLRERGDLSGVSSLARTLPPDDEVRALATTILSSLSWQGPVLVEMHRDAAGVLRLHNVIGRLWGSVQLAINAGLDVPVLCDGLVKGTAPAVVRTAEPGHLWRWIVGDLEVMALRAKRLVSRVDGAGELRARLRGFAELFQLSELLDAEPDVWDAADPLPFVLEVEHRIEETRRQRKARALLTP